MGTLEQSSVRHPARWAEKKRVQVQLYKARGQGSGHKARYARVDLRVRVEGWGQVLWHMLLAWYCSPHPGLTRAALASKQAAHLNDNPRVIDFRQVGIEDKA